MIINLQKEISVDALITCVWAQHGEKGLHYLARKALQILVNESAKDIIIDDVSLRPCLGCGEDFVARDSDDKHEFCNKCDAMLGENNG